MNKLTICALTGVLVAGASFANDIKEAKDVLTAHEDDGVIIYIDAEGQSNLVHTETTTNSIFVDILPGQRLGPLDIKF